MVLHRHVGEVLPLVPVGVQVAVGEKGELAGGGAALGQHRVGGLGGLGDE